MIENFGGSISAEHGVGLTKKAFLHHSRSPVEIAAMRSIKKIFDPDGILNPGKMFDVFEVWKHARLNVHLPWDHK